MGIGSLLIISPSFAAGSLGDFAESLLDIEKNLDGLINTFCIVVGGALILGSLMLYHRHRQNPIEVTWTRIIVMLVAGLIVIGLAFFPMPFK